MILILRCFLSVAKTVKFCADVEDHFWPQHAMRAVRPRQVR